MGMPLVTLAELTSMRNEATSTLDQRGTIRRATAGQGTYGTSKPTWADKYTNVPCTLQQPTGPNMAALASKLTTQRVWVVWFPYGTDVQSGDLLVIGTDTLLIEIINTPESYPMLVHALATENG